MGMRFNKSGCIFEAYAKNQELHVVFEPGLEIVHPLPFIKEDFLISHTWQISNVCLLCESESRDLLIAWFTGTIAVYRPVGDRYRFIAMSGFDIDTFKYTYLNVYPTGTIEDRLRQYVTRTSLYDLNCYMVKGNDEKVIIDPFDTMNGYVIDVEKNIWILNELATGSPQTPGFRRLDDTLVLIYKNTQLVNPYIIKQSDDLHYSYNL